MSDKYCSAGKIECEVYSLDNSASGYCQASFVDRRWEQCPWPSRQRPVEKAGGDGLTVGEAVEAANFVSAIIRNAKSAGINEGVERAKMAIRSCSRCEIEKYTICRERIAACKAKP
jgi:hypothetical protein